jgi:hypothetical protein
MSQRARSPQSKPLCQRTIELEPLLQFEFSWSDSGRTPVRRQYQFGAAKQWRIGRNVMIVVIAAKRL